MFDTTRVIGSIILKAANRISAEEISCSPERHLIASVLDFNVSKKAWETNNKQFSGYHVLSREINRKIKSAFFSERKLAQRLQPILIRLCVAFGVDRGLGRVG